MLDIQKRISAKVATLTHQLIAYRRHLHQYPELSFQEYKTSAYVQNILKEQGIPFTILVNTGIVALIEGKSPTSCCIALRADMDALPITEKNNHDFISKNEGRMHACGHDVHTTCLLGAMLVLQELKDEFEGTIKLIFQPGEEVSPGGANLMIQEGVLENPKVDGIIGLHVFPELPSGYLGFRAGEYMASSDELFITIKGKGGHAALPHKCVDPVTIAANVIMSLQQLVARKANALTPTVLSFGKIQGGHTNNVIPDEVVLEGTLRTFDEVWRKEALELIEKICRNTAESYGGAAVFNHPEGYPSVHNDVAFTQYLENAAKTCLGADKIVALDRRMTAEDFSFYTQKTKGCFFRLGTNKNNEAFTTPVHNAQFDIDESAIDVGVTAMVNLALHALKF